MINKLAAIVLAGGQGTRMKSDLPKVLHPLNGKPLIAHVLESLNKSGIDSATVVIGYKGQMVIDALGTKASFVWQHEQLGTGHAVMQAEDGLKDFEGRVVVACGDVPLIKPETFKSLIARSEGENVKAVVLTMEMENPTGYGRILKDANGNFARIVEEKDASPEEKTITEVNSGTYVFDKEFLFQGLKQIDTNNAQGEYYLPDALEYIINSGYTVQTEILKDPIEGSGINTKEELLSLEKYVKEVMK
ncbi:MAG: NTP transferase domain-containing protein [bacterium]|nr:NTP transferase domain-containing protein [bacterium]